MWRRLALWFSPSNGLQGLAAPHGTEITLPADGLWTARAGSQGFPIACREGSVWITQEGDSRDVILMPGQRFQVEKPGVVVVQALDRATIRVVGHDGRVPG